MGLAPVHIQAHIAFQFIAASQDARLQYPFHVRAFQLLESLPGLFLFRFRKFVRCHCFLNHIHIVKGDTGCPVGIAPLYVSCNLVAFGNLLFFFTGRRRGLPHIINFRIIQFLKRSRDFREFRILIKGFAHSENRLCFLFGIKGSQIKVPGWRGIYNEPSEKEEGSLLPEFQEDEILPVLGIDTLVKKTKPQPIFTEASLLAAMEGCGRTLDDEKEKEAMEDSGLGTPATRAGIIELLIARHYVERNGRSLIPTPKGLEVYDIVKEKMSANVSMTGGWECALHEIETGKVSTETFTQSINSYTQQITSELLALKLNHPDLPHCNCPKCGAETIIVFNKVAKCSDPNCGFLLFRTFNGRELTDNQMLLLLSGKRTGYLKFTSKKGKKYEASLELDDNYRIEMTFKDNKPKK